MADDFERLVISFDARFDAMQQQLTAMNSFNDRMLSSMEKRATSFQSSFTKSFANAGSGAMRSLTAALGVGVSLAALDQVASSISNQVENIKKQSAALGVSTDTFQEWSLSAQRAGVSQDVLNIGLDNFAKNMGEAQLKQTAFGKDAQALGVNLHGTVTQALYQYIDGLARVDNQGQKAALTQMAFGRGAVQLVPWLQQGSAAIQQMGLQLKANGEIIDEDGIKKIDAMTVAWGDMKAELQAEVGATVLAGMSSELGQITDEMKNPQFQAGLRTFGQTLADAAASVAKMAPYLPTIAAAFVGFKVGGPFGGAAGATVGYEYQNRNSLREWGLENVQIPQQQNRVDVLTESHAPQEQITRANQLLNQLKNELSLARIKAQAGSLPGIERPAAASGANMQSLLRVMQGQPADQKPLGKLDLSGINDTPQTSAYAKAVQAVKDRVAALKDQSAAEADTTMAEEKSRTSTELLTAAQEDASKRGGQVSAAQLAQIDQLSTAYAKLAAARAFAGDLKTEDDRIAKLATEADKARMTTAAVAQLESQQDLVEKWHSTRFGAGAIPDKTVAATATAPEIPGINSINAEAAKAGTAAGNNAFAGAMGDAQKQTSTISDQIAALGLFGGAAAAAEMKQTLLNAAMKANGTVTEEQTKDIAALAAKFGALTQQEEQLRLQQQNAVELNDDFRDGLESLGATGVTQFKNLKSAAHDFVLELAQMIAKIGLMQPIVSELFGPPDSAGQGALGGATGFLTRLITGGGAPSAAMPGVPALSMAADGSLTQSGVPSLNLGGAAASGGWLSDVEDWIGNLFADGGIMTGRGRVPLRRYSGGGVASSPQLAMFGEGSGPEAFVPLKDGGIPVNMRMPRVPQLSRGPQAVNVSPVFNVDARGAQVGVADQIDAKMRAAAPAIIQESVRQSRGEFVSNMYRAQRDNF